MHIFQLLLSSLPACSTKSGHFLTVTATLHPCALSLSTLHTYSFEYISLSLSMAPPLSPPLALLSPPPPPSPSTFSNFSTCPSASTASTSNFLPSFPLPPPPAARALYGYPAAPSRARILSRALPPPPLPPLLAPSALSLPSPPPGSVVSPARRRRRPPPSSPRPRLAPTEPSSTTPACWTLPG